MRMGTVFTGEPPMTFSPCLLSKVRENSRAKQGGAPSLIRSNNNSYLSTCSGIAQNLGLLSLLQSKKEKCQCT